jgi:DNA-binding NarL/FixJ family response regulator
MEVRTPLPDIREVLEVTVRMRRLQRPIDVIVLDWEGSALSQDQRLETLSALSRQQQACLVLVDHSTPEDVAQIKQAGARGYFFTTASFPTFVSAIRLLARRKEETYFPPLPEPSPSSFDAADLSVSHRLIFYRERLDACASSIQWELTEKEVLLIRQFGEQTAELTEEMKHSSSRNRYALSQRIYPFLSLLSGKAINSRFLAFQVLLEYGILQYIRCS